MEVKNKKPFVYEIIIFLVELKGARIEEEKRLLRQPFFFTVIQLKGQVYQG
ncbi:hypothetical protein ACIQYG_25955 [Peribacillus sp. NPDC096622]|uniref:hypothetical protein n=1 Tax=Peribacillus sp. NPDC096622 TaxID=3364396 RepID=UPI003802660F